VTTQPISTNRRFLTGLIGYRSRIRRLRRCTNRPPTHSARAVITISSKSRTPGARNCGILLDGIRRLGFAGVNVTFPYKEAVIELLDALSPGAASIGAVNTVVVRDNKLTGHNTDTTGFCAGRHRTGHRFRTRPCRGDRAPAGSARPSPLRSRVSAFPNCGCSIPTAPRSTISPNCCAAIRACGLPTASRTRCTAPSAWSTDAGRDAAEPGTPVPEALLRRDLWVADAVYSPLWTPLLTAAKAKGASVMTGRDLAIYQAADAFELFTGLKPSTVEMEMHSTPYGEEIRCDKRSVKAAGDKAAFAIKRY